MIIIDLKTQLTFNVIRQASTIFAACLGWDAQNKLSQK